MRLLSAPHSPQASPQTIDHKMQQAGLRILKHNCILYPANSKLRVAKDPYGNVYKSSFQFVNSDQMRVACVSDQSLDRVGYGECWCSELGWGRQDLSVAVVGLNSPAPAPAGLWAPASSAPRRRVSLLYQWSPVEQSTPGG